MIKRILTLFILVCVLSGCGSVPERKQQKHCPVCDSPVEYEPDYEYAIRWLEKHDFTVIGKSEKSEFVWDYLINNYDDLMDFLNDSGWINDILEDHAAAYLEDNGWTVSPPEETS